MAEIDLEQKFPEMQPVESVPLLGSIYGFGFSLYGARDHDEETLTHVTTYCLCAVFIPVLALRAYRVARDESCYYVLGRVPLSGLARFWNYLVVASALLLASVVAWNAYSGSEGYLARQKMAEADHAAEAGEFLDAARLYAEVATGQTRHAEEAVEKIQGLLDKSAQMPSLEDAAAVWQVAVRLKQQGHLPTTAAKLLEGAVALVEQHAEADPRGALAVLEAVTPLAPDAEDLSGLRQQLLERIVAREPDDAEAASTLAVLYEAQGELSKCESLLAPHADRLGEAEGARILGQIWARQGKFEEAHALLLPYCQRRLERLHAAEEQYTRTVSQVQEQVLNQLRAGEAPGFPYQRAREAAQAEQDTLVQEYVYSRLKDDPGIKEAQEAMLKRAAVVPVALDLGMVILRRAQDQADPEIRRAELEKAEKTFLAVRGMAGETDQYRLNLGQVYYWLGKHDQGRELFDQLLEAQNRSFEILSGVSQLLREVGAESEARDLIEEAYNKAQDQQERYQAALGRAIMPVDLDDRIAWLRRANPSDLDVQAELSVALGNRAIRDGQEQEAVAHLRKAIGLYGRLTENAATLNNGAWAHVLLYQITGDRRELEKAVARFERAVALKPDDSILLGNLATWTLEAALSEIIGESIDLRALKMTASLDLLAYLYGDESGRSPYVDRVRSSPGVAKALSHLDKLLLLAPKRADVYTSALSIHSYTRNLDALLALSRRMEAVELDLADSRQEALDFYTGRKDDEIKREYGTIIARYEEVAGATRENPSVTFAVAAASVVKYRLVVAMMGEATDADGLVRLAEEAHDAAPSSATRGTLISALLFRAHQALVGDEPAYAQMASKAMRSLGAGYLVAVALSEEGAPREAALGNADVKRALDLAIEAGRKMPEGHSPWDWALLRAAHPDIASEIAEAVRRGKVGDVRRAIGLRLGPLSATVAFDTYWAHRIAGKDQEAVEVLRGCAAGGVPLPFDPK